MSISVLKPQISIKKQVLSAALAIVGAVAVPQLVHVIGFISGAGTTLGETFLPMHLPIILVGLLAGPYAGAIAGLLGPLLSFLMTGMPSSVMLPFMMIELCIYGLSSGLIKNSKIPTIGKVVISQVAGRVVRAIAIIISVYAFSNSVINAAVIWKSIAIGLPGIALQWALIPLIVYRAEK